jgi:uncharacterized protein YecE (DUF72 family)
LPSSDGVNKLAASTPQLFIGMSGWVFKEWAGPFYKDEHKGSELEFYSTHFNTVEINATFYRLPLLSTAKRWYQRTPADFIFAVKGSRFITHLKRLKPEALGIRRFFNRIKPLQEKCGPILWQIPPNFAFDAERLESFFKRLPNRWRHAFEFRHPSWYENPVTFELLKKYQVAHVSLSSLRMPMRLERTTDFVYLRFHGLEGGLRHDYTRAELRPWARHARDCLKQGCTVYAYFNNDMTTQAIANAKTFMKMVNR